MEIKWKKIAGIEYGKIVFHSISYHALPHTVEASHCSFNCRTSSREAVNTNFFSLWFDPTGNQTRVYRFNSRRSIHSTTVSYWAIMRKRKLEAVKFLWKRKRMHFDERDWKRKWLFLSGAGSGSKKFQRWGSGSKLGSINFKRSWKRKH